MNFPPKIDCYVCGRTKGETNHWYLVAARTLQVFGWTEQSTEACTDLGERHDLAITDFREDGKGKPVCGNNCTQKLVERWLHTRSLEPPRGSAADAAPRATAGDPA